MAFRPNGVTALAIIFIIFAALGVIAAIFIEAVLIPQYHTSNYINILSFLTAMYYFTVVAPYGPAQFEVFLIAFQSFFMNNGLNFAGYIPFVHVGVLIGLIIAPLLIISAVGLFGMKQWGRYLGIIVGILIIIGGIVTAIIVLTIGGIAIVIAEFCIYVVPAGIMIVFYLYSVVKEDFEMR